MNNLITNKTKIWSIFLEKIKNKISPQQYSTWFENLELAKLDKKEIQILVPNLFCKEWLENNYMDTISTTIKEITNLKPKINLEAKEGKNESNSLASKYAEKDNDTPINKNYTFENFLVGPCNRMPHAAAIAVCQWPGISYNPLFIHGSVGLGKTHLLQAIYLRLKQNKSQHSILYLPCETFVNHYISTIKTGDWENFRNRYRQIDILLIDDVHFLANSQNSREEFFHTFNALYSHQKQIVLSSDCPPEEIPTIEDRLISRFRWGLITNIDPPNFETSVAIIQRKASLLNIYINYETACLIAEKASSNIREIESFILNISKHASLNKSKIDINLVKQVLHGFTSVRKYAGIEDIINSVTKHFGVQLSQLHSKRKLKSITLPRQITMYLARKLTNLSLEEIGGYMGGRDHTTVIHANEKIKRLKKSDCNLSAMLIKIENDISKSK